MGIPDMAIIRKFLQYAAGNVFAQNLLERHLRKVLKYMGIGSGGNVATSGEVIGIRKMMALLPPPYCIFDAGANRGQFLRLVLSTIQTGQFEIHCFEPASHTFGLLKENLYNATADKKIVLNNFGLGAHTAERELFYNEPGSEIASLTKRRVDHFNIDFSRSETVNIETLDNYCQNNGIDQIDLLKIDVEGHELDILNTGAEHMFANESIKIVCFEFGGCNIDTRTFFQDFFYRFQSLDMQLYRITPSGYLYPINEYKESFEQFSTTNFLAVHRSLTG